MKHRGRRVAIATAALAAAALALAAWAAKEPLFDRWYLWKLERAVAAKDEGERARLILLLVARKCGAVVPNLLRFRRDHPHQGSIGKDPVYYEREEARLASIGPPAAPWLVAALDDPDCGDMAFLPLIALGPDAATAVPALVRSPETKDGPVVDGYLQVAGAIGPAAAPAVPAILGFARHPDATIRNTAYGALAGIGGAGAKTAVPVLLDAVVSEEDFENAGEAAAALDRVEPGRGPEEALRLAAGSEPADKMLAAYVLGGYRSRAAAAVPALLRLAGDETEAIALRALASIGRLEDGATAAVPRLVEMCRSGSPEIAAAAGRALGKIGVATPDVPGIVVRLAYRNEESLDEDCLLDFAQKPGNAAKIACALVEQLRPGAARREDTIRLLARIGPGAAGAIPSLERIASGTDELSDLARDALKCIREPAGGGDEGVFIFPGSLEDLAFRR